MTRALPPAFVLRFTPAVGPRWHAWSQEPSWTVLAIIAGTALLRVGMAALTGLGIDESYMVAAGRVPQLSYYDHPPLAWWLAWAAAHLFGSEAPLAVRLPFIALFALSTLLMFRLAAALFSPRAGLWAVVAFNLSPVFGVTTGSWVLPDGPLLAALLGFLLCLVRATVPGERGAWWWLGAGLCAGLALLSKYNAVLVLAGGPAALLSHPDGRRWLRRPQPWMALMLTACLCAPVLVWNAQHGWSSIAFQAGRGSGWAFHPWAPFAVLGGEALFVLPWLWLPAMVVFVRTLRQGPAFWPAWLLSCCALPAIALFPLVGLWSSKPMLFHWAAPGYLALFPLLGAALDRWSCRHGRVLRRSATATALVLVAALALVGSEVRWNWLPALGERFENGADPDLDLLDWTPFATQMRERGWIGPGAPALATLRWQDAGKLSYALGRDVPVFCLGADPREFGLTAPADAHRGQDILLLLPGPWRPTTDRKRAGLFRAVERLASLVLSHAGQPAMVVSVQLGQDLRATGLAPGPGA